MEANYLNIQILLIYLEIKIYLIIYIDLRESNVSHFGYILKKNYGDINNNKKKICK